MKHIVKEKAVKLREKGYSYSYIKNELHVSKSTLSYWLGNIPYTPNKETSEKIGNAHVASARAKNKLKMESFRHAEAEAKKEIGALSKRDIFMFGLGLYAGEGTKTHDIVRIINSNPEIIKFVIKWFKTAYHLKNSNFTVRIHLYPDNDIKQALLYWSDSLGIPLNQFQQTQIDTRIGKKMFKRGKLPHGTAHMTVKSNGEKKFGVFLARKINALLSEVFTK
jgi:hypothetical protein